MNFGKHSSKWINSAARRRLHLAQRARLARILGWPVDCVASTGEMIQTLRERDAHERSTRK
jgi:hypothetical protein